MAESSANPDNEQPAETESVSPPSEEAAGEVAIEEESATETELRARIEGLEGEKRGLVESAAKLKDQLLRTAADFENFRKRAARQEAESAEAGRSDAIRALLPVIDNLERALPHAEGFPGAEKVADGLRLVLKSFSDAFASYGLKRFVSVGQPFDPMRHEAIGQLETTEHPAGTVASEFQAGYLLKERLLRPALVQVARPPAAAPDAPSGDAQPETPPAAGGEE